MRNKQKFYYTLEWGKKGGQRFATGIFTYINPVSAVQQYHNEASLRLLEIKKAQMTLDYLAVGTVGIPSSGKYCLILLMSSGTRRSVNRMRRYCCAPLQLVM